MTVPASDAGGPPLTTPGARSSAGRWRTFGVVAAGGVLLVGYDRLAARLGPVCPFHAATGLDCPFCGGTRALHALLRGDVAAAVDHNLLVMLLLAAGVAAAGWWALTRIVPALPRPDGQAVLAADRTWIAVAAVLGVWWLLRNLPFLAYLRADAG